MDPGVGVEAADLLSFVVEALAGFAVEAVADEGFVSVDSAVGAGAVQRIRRSGRATPCGGLLWPRPASCRARDAHVPRGRPRGFRGCWRDAGERSAGTVPAISGGRACAGSDGPARPLRAAAQTRGQWSLSSTMIARSLISSDFIIHTSTACATVCSRGRPAPRRFLFSSSRNRSTNYKTKTAARTSALSVGAHEFETHQWPQPLHLCGGALFPTWMPSMFRTTKGLTKKFRSKRLEGRARYRWSRVQRYPDGSMKFRCPQCSGRLASNLTTHNGRKPNKSAPDIAVPRSGECCNGLTTVPVKNLDLWQPMPWGTRAWEMSYHRRSQVENVNGMLRINGRAQPWLLPRQRHRRSHLCGVGARRGAQSEPPTNRPARRQ